MANRNQTADEQAAIRSFEAALAERKRLEALRVTLNESRDGARNAADAARKAADAAGVDAMLALPEMRADARWGGHHMQERAQEAEAEHQRIEAALRALPDKLAEADDHILAAAKAAAPAIAAVRGRAMDAYHAEMSAAMRQFLPVLLKGLALAQSVNNGQRWLENNQLNSPSSVGGMNLQHGNLSLDGTTIRLQDTWLENAEAKSAYENLHPLLKLDREITSHQFRIQAVKRDAEIQRSFAAPVRQQHSQLPSPASDPNYRPPWYPRAGVVEPVRSYMIRRPGDPDGNAAIEVKERQMREKRAAEAARYAGIDPSAKADLGANQGADVAE